MSFVAAGGVLFRNSTSPLAGLRGSPLVAAVAAAVIAAVTFGTPVAADPVAGSFQVRHFPRAAAAAAAPNATNAVVAAPAAGPLRVFGIERNRFLVADDSHIVCAVGVNVAGAFICAGGDVIIQIAQPANAATRPEPI